MDPSLIAVVLALASAVAYATAAVAQERLAGTGRRGGVAGLLLCGAWWGAVGLNATGALLHVAALTYGPLTLVQPLGALTLVAAVPLGARLAGRRVLRTEWRGTALALLGLGALLPVTGGAAPEDTLALSEALSVAAVVLALITVLTRPGRGPGGRGLRFAAASGIASGVASALTQTLTVALTARTGTAVLSWPVLAVAVLVAAFAVSGLLLSQTAYAGGGLGAPLATLTLANPVAAAAIGIALLGERLHGGPAGTALALAGAAAAARGVVLLSRAQQPAGPAPRPAGSAPASRQPVPAALPVPVPPAQRTSHQGTVQPVLRSGVPAPGILVPVLPALGLPASAGPEPTTPLSGEPGPEGLALSCG
ncbi:DMT family transporter [Streptomyces sp. NA02950]|uniref:DMT family transporter n=1 Tax=Streptomyces sp. NA02950 TaxID=2742137 RepID=UPI0015921E4D|nr:DMT family transporter [Streptomyces sp. NA02950]QKV95285.1 DMT family transporter [Streptomyces sp. NA02950]